MDGRKINDLVTLQSMDEEEGNTFTLDFRQMRSKAKSQHAWARTIHTFQVSRICDLVAVTGCLLWNSLQEQRNSGLLWKGHNFPLKVSEQSFNPKKTGGGAF